MPTTSPSLGFSLALSGIYIPPAVFSSASVTNFINEMQAGNIGVLFLHSHANATVYGIEFYEDTAQGQVARDVAYNNYIAQGINPDFLTIFHGHSGYGIGVTDDGLDNWCTNLDESLVYAKGCHSSGLNDNWSSLAALGYSQTISGLSGVDTFFERMDGTTDRGQGNMRRSVDDARDGINHLVATGNLNVVLSPVVLDYEPEKRPEKIKVKLKDGKEREIQHMIATSFWSADGKPISAQEFLENLFGELPNFFKDEKELREIWSNPQTRKTLLEKLDEAGFGKEELTTLQKLINAEKSDLFDVLEYVFDSDFKPITREERATRAKATIFALLNDKQKEFIEFVLNKYVEAGISELDQEKLPILLQTKYQSLEDAMEILGDVQNISSLFIEFQKHLYDIKVA